MRALFRFLVVPVLLAGLVLAGLVAVPATADPTGSPSPAADPTATSTDPSATATTTAPGPTSATTSPSSPSSPSSQTTDTTTPSSPSSTTSSPSLPLSSPSSPSSLSSPSTTDPGTTDPTVPAPVRPTATIDFRSVRPVTTVRSASFAFSSDQPLATFECRLTHHTVATDTWAPCRSGRTFSGIRTGYHTFQVRAVLTVAGQQPQVLTSAAANFQWRIFGVISPDNYYVRPGASFNIPLGTATMKRRNLTHVIRTINSMPGYVVSSQAACPTAPVDYPSTIRISLYSATDMAFARALVAASRRCVSVQILMNNHLTPQDTRSIRFLETNLGNRVYAAGTARRSFSHRCWYGCRGGGVLHSKFYLFETAPGLVLQRYHLRIGKTVMVGSSNMTSNAAGVQWNDLYTVKSNPTLHSQFLSVFNVMKRDRNQRKTLAYTTGIYHTVFTPITPGGADPTMTALRSIHCSGATGGTGVNGHTLVYINIHAWFGVRGYAFANQVRSLYARGCYVRILYSFMSKSVIKKLTYGTGSRMSARRTIFARPGRLNAYIYSHFKNIAVSGNVGSDTSASVVWTGSNNFTNDGLVFDEVTMRIASLSAYRQYRDQFLYITKRKTSPIWASLLEPIGGGRAIETNV